MIEGALFTLEFLLQGIRETEVWRALDDAHVSKLRDDAKLMLDAVAARRNPNEAQTEDDLVYPLLELSFSTPQGCSTECLSEVAKRCSRCSAVFRSKRKSYCGPTPFIAAFSAWTLHS